MTQQMRFAVPGKQAWWLVAGAMGGFAGLALDFAAAGALSGEAAKWGCIGALSGAAVGVASLFATRCTAGRLTRTRQVRMGGVTCDGMNAPFDGAAAMAIALSVP